MTPRIIFIFLIWLFLSAFSGSVMAEEPSLSEAADELCQSFLELMDQHQYTQAYELIAPQFRQTETQPQWRDRVSSERESVGEFKSRRLAKVEKVDAFANLPEGDYLLAIYETTFTGQAETRETVVLTPAEDGYKLAAYEFSRNVWPEALRIIGNGLFVVFFIMILLAVVTWAMGKFVQKIENSKKEEKGS